MTSLLDAFVHSVSDFFARLCKQSCRQRSHSSPRMLLTKLDIFGRALAMNALDIV